MKKKILLLGLPLIILIVTLVTGFTLAGRLFVLSVLVILVGFVWSCVSIRGLESRAKPLPARCQVGESFKQEIVLSNRDRLPKLFLEVKEESDLPGYFNYAAVNLPPEGSRSLAAEVHCRRRGEYHLGALSVTASDPLGLFQRRISTGEPQDIIVCPATHELPLFEPLSHQGTGYGPERWLAGQLGPVASIREYMAGDSLKRIHWHSTAHTGKLMVKVFDPERSRKVARSAWIALDLHQPVQLVLGDDSTEELAITIAASVIKKYIDEAMPIGMVAAGDRHYLFPPGAGEPHLWQVLTALALAKASGGTPVEQLIQSESSRFGYNSILIVITPSLSERLAATLRQVRSHGGVVVAILIDPASFGGDVSAGGTARSLLSHGVQVHVIGRGDDLTVALDSRITPHLPEAYTKSGILAVQV